MAAMQTARDVPMLITCGASSSERRITPSWTITQLKAKIEQVTGIPPSSQGLMLHAGGQKHSIEAEDEDAVQVGKWPLVDYAEIKVSHTELWGLELRLASIVIVCHVTRGRNPRLDLGPCESIVPNYLSTDCTRLL